MQTWLVPFIYLAVVVGFYLLAPGERRLLIQKHVKKEPNFYMLCDIILIALSIPATLAYRQRWLDYLAWGLLVVFLVLSAARLWKAGQPQPEPEPDHRID